MRITVRDDKGKPLGAIGIKVVDLSDKEAAEQVDSLWHRLVSWLAGKIAQKEKVQKTAKKQLAIQADKSPKTIEIKISLPHIPSRAQLMRRARGASRRSWAVALACLAILIIGLYAFLANGNAKTTSAISPKPKPTLERGTPKYKTIIPESKTIAQLGGWARVSPANRAPVYAYVDRIGAVQIRVSEQPLPVKFIGDPGGQLAKLAQSFNANEKFQAANTTIYLATYSNGSQYLMFVEGDLLILINSSDSLSNDQWATYINALK